MSKVTSSVVINKPVTEVFAFVTDPHTGTKWQGGVDALIPEGPQDVGAAKYNEVHKLMSQDKCIPLLRPLPFVV
jgi:uncharacterized protein YndB with AHSA1/START domain